LTAFLAERFDPGFERIVPAVFFLLLLLLLLFSFCLSIWRIKFVDGARVGSDGVRA
jgi:uncharacterized protein (DUF58 family)